MAQVKKISVATVYGAIDLKALYKREEEGKGPLAVMRVGGLAIGSKSDEGVYGTWTALVGRFAATNPETGEIVEAAQLFLPDVALTPILVALSQEGTKSVDFAIEVLAGIAKDSKPGGSPYEYTFNDLKPISDSDPMKATRALLLGAGQGDQKQLATSEQPAATPASGGRKR